VRRDAVEQIVQRTAGKFSGALDTMVADLPVEAAPHMAIALVVAELARRQKWLMMLIMEDPDIREAYAAAVASLPATACGKP
jgi:hypothetical protein